MYQFYALNILFNIVGGVTLAYGFFEEKMRFGDFLNEEGIRNEVFRTAIGALTLLFGFAKLISVTEGNWYVLGDFFPAIAGMATGFTLLLERWYREEARTEVLDARSLRYRLERVFILPKNVYGGISVIAGIVHLLFHHIPLL